MIREEVTKISEHDGTDRCEHNYGGIWEQCTENATHAVTVAIDLGESEILVCDEHLEKFQ